MGARPSPPADDVLTASSKSTTVFRSICVVYERTSPLVPHLELYLAESDGFVLSRSVLRAFRHCKTFQLRPHEARQHHCGRCLTPVFRMCQTNPCPSFGKSGHFLAPGVPCFPAAALAPGESKRPLVIFSHGLGGNRGLYSALAAEMASCVSGVIWPTYRDTVVVPL